MKKLKQWIKDKLVIICIILYIGFAIGGYFIININFSKDALSYFGTVLAGFGTVLIGLVAFNQNKQANKINERLLLLEQEKSVFFLTINFAEIIPFLTNGDNVGIRVAGINNSNRAISINEISDMNMNILKSQQIYKLTYLGDKRKQQFFLPNQTFQLVFSGKGSEDLYEQIQLLNSSTIFSECKFSLMYCTLDGQQTYNFDYKLLITNKKEQYQ